MLLPNDFHFTQNNLQDYLTCPRRFELRHILHQPWPAVQSEPAREVEKHIERGSRFHHMIQQQKCGVSIEHIAGQTDDPQLHIWWQNYLDHAPRGLPETQWVEFLLSTPFLSYRLFAKYDLLAIDPQKECVIIDWKTSQFKPKGEKLSGHVQTRVYPLLLTLAGRDLNNNQAIQSEQLKMIYWFSEYPTEPIEIRYSNERKKADMEYLTNLINEISSLEKGEFGLTANLKSCRYCVYRSLCARGQSAGDWKEDETLDFEQEDISLIDLNQIPEIEF